MERPPRKLGRWFRGRDSAIFLKYVAGARNMDLAIEYGLSRAHITSIVIKQRNESPEFKRLARNIAFQIAPQSKTSTIAPCK